MKNIYKTESYFVTTGYIKSIFEKKISDDEGELPWLSYGVIDILKNRVNKEMTVFEYGAGNSTIWWSKRVKKITSVEHDSEWYERLKGSTKLIRIEGYDISNLIYRSLDEGYENVILDTNDSYDIIVIDGRKRVKCVEACIKSKSLKEDGVIIWDDSNREHYNSGIEMLKKNGFKELCFRGIGAMGSGMRQTSIFYRDNNCLNI